MRTLLWLMGSRKLAHSWMALENATLCIYQLYLTFHPNLVSPVLGHVLPEEQLIEGEDLRLSCVVVVGTPKPTIRWYKDGKELEQTDSIIVMSFPTLVEESQSRRRNQTIENYDQLIVRRLHFGRYFMLYTCSICHVVPSIICIAGDKHGPLPTFL